MNFNKKTRIAKISTIFGVTLAFATSMGSVANAAPSNLLNPDQPVSLTVHKYSGNEIPDAPNDGSAISDNSVFATNGNMPLAGVDFTVCEVDGVDLNSGWGTIDSLNSAIQSSPDHAFPSLPGVTLSDNCSTQTTNIDGVAQWNNLDQGVFYVTETKAPATVVEKTLPFLVTLPMSQSDDSWLYNVNVYPKNAVSEISKTVTNPGDVGLGNVVSWQISNKVPTTKGSFTDYRLRDVLDSRLTYVEGSSNITLNTISKKTNKSVLLTNDDYNVNVETVNGVETLTVSFTPTGLTKLEGNQTVSWTFKTIVKTLGNGVIENDASVLINNPDGTWDEAINSNKVSSNWGALRINKIENTVEGEVATPLEGASFQIFGSETAAATCLNEVKKADGTLVEGCDNAVTVLVDDNGKMLTNPQNIFTTNADGEIFIPGLNVGVNDETQKEYWLVEIVAPEGYLNANVIYPATVTAGGVDWALEVTISNDKVVNPPEPGKPGTTTPAKPEPGKPTAPAKPTGTATNLAIVAASLAVIFGVGIIAFTVSRKDEKAEQ